MRVGWSCSCCYGKEISRRNGKSRMIRKKNLTKRFGFWADCVRTTTRLGGTVVVMAWVVVLSSILCTLGRGLRAQLWFQLHSHWLKKWRFCFKWIGLHYTRDRALNLSTVTIIHNGANFEFKPALLKLTSLERLNYNIVVYSNEFKLGYLRLTLI